VIEGSAGVGEGFDVVDGAGGGGGTASVPTAGRDGTLRSMYEADLSSSAES
jgi:hypothetical protein